MNHDSVRIAIVASMFNEKVSGALLTGALARLKECQIDEASIDVIKVPGAIEIPLTAKLLAKTNQYQAIICLGSVIRGETTHYDYVCEQVSRGCQDIMLNYEVPIIFGVLTTENVSQALDRVGGNKGHKGRDAADVALHMINVVERLGAITPSFNA